MLFSSCCSEIPDATFLFEFFPSLLTLGNVPDSPLSNLNGKCIAGKNVANKLAIGRTHSRRKQRNEHLQE
jgi:hypothetical protein